MTARKAPPIVLILSLLVSVVTSGSAHAQSGETPGARDLFFEGLDLRERGDVEGALARFQLALAGDPSLHQARLHVAECFFELEMYEEAIREAQAYLDADFDMAEVNRAHTLIGLCSFELKYLPPSTDAAAEPETSETPDAPETPGAPDIAETGDAVADSVEPDVSSELPIAPAEVPIAPADVPAAPVEVRSVPPAAAWAPALVYTGVAVTHIANTAGLTTAGPVLGARFLPLRYLEVGIRARLGFGPYSERGGTVRLPDLGVGAAGSIPVGAVRIHLGVMVPVVFSGYGGETRADVGVTGEIGIRVAAKGTRLVIGGQLEAGYLVRPLIAGGFCVGVQVGPMR